MIFEYRCQRCGNIQESNDSPDVIHVCYYCGRVDIPLYSADLYYLDFDSILRILADELVRRKEKVPVKVKYYWTDKTGLRKPIHKLKTSHVEHIIGFVNKMRRNSRCH